MSDLQPEEGDDCKVAGCDGKLVFKYDGECTCHISPPCNRCVTGYLSCDECGEYYGD